MVGTVEHMTLEEIDWQLGINFSEEDVKRHEEALSGEKTSREEAQRTNSEHVAALEEELRKLQAALHEAKADTHAKVEALRSASEEATKKWASALRRTLQEFGE